MLEGIVSNVKGLALAGFLYGSLIGCSQERIIEKNIVHLPADYDTTNHYIFAPKDGKENKSNYDIEDYKSFNLLFGLNLDGSFLGFDFKNKYSLQEITVSERAYNTFGIKLPIGMGFEQYTYVGRLYTDQNVKEITFCGKTYLRNEFEFLKLDWTWGLGLGMKFALINRPVMLADSSVVNALYQTSIHPTLSTFATVYADKKKNFGVKLIFDIDHSAPPAIQLGLGLSFRLD